SLCSPPCSPACSRVWPAAPVHRPRPPLPPAPHRPAPPKPSTLATGLWSAWSTAPPARFGAVCLKAHRPRTGAGSTRRQAATPIDVELPGAFAFDGLSGDGQRLYVLQLRRDGGYQVKLYDLVTHRLAPDAIVDKTDASTVMSGAPVNSLTSADGQEQLTLYERDSRNQSFVHVLP